MTSARPAAPGLRRTTRLAVVTLAVTLVQVAWGAFTRGSGSGYGCGDSWPLCQGGLIPVGDRGGLLPRPEFEMVVEWTHRWIAAVVVVLVAGLAVRAWRHHRGVGRIVWPAAVAVGVVLLQSGLGALVVMSDLQADLVAVHMVVATLLLAALAVVAVNSAALAATTTTAAVDRRWSRLLTLGAAGVLVTLVLGSSVHDQYVGGWPLVGGQLVPDALGRSPVVDLHYAHRVAAAVVCVYLAGLAWAAVRRHRPRSEVRLVHTALALFVVNVGLGAVHVVTQVSSVVAIVAHLGVGAASWTAVVAATTLARRHSEAAARALGQAPAEEPVGTPA